MLPPPADAPDHSHRRDRARRACLCAGREPARLAVRPESGAAQRPRREPPRRQPRRCRRPRSCRRSARPRSRRRTARTAAAGCGAGGRVAAASAEPAGRRSPRPPAISPAALNEPLSERQIVERANAYFNGMSTLTGDFVQTGGDGRRLTGKLYLQRPGKIRFEYDAPATIEVIADGSLGGGARQQARDPGPLCDLADAAEVPAPRPYRSRPGHPHRRRLATSAMARASSSRTNRRSAAPRRSRCSSTQVCARCTLAHRRPAGLHDHRRCCRTSTAAAASTRACS